jgi:hypothetical protein
MADDLLRAILSDKISTAAAITLIAAVMWIIYLVMHY